MSDVPDNSERLSRIKGALRQAFAPEELRVEDESHLHVGHAGAQSGRGHFRVRITAEAFRDQKLLARHRAIYDALGDMMQTDIHALAIHARAPGESAGV
ncbi:BolA family protein [Algiphilus aromaticivorans]|uniref:BolA family protein n=1 Tax=Algiphilus aromaticivorans TaxID=382454 RepID=UPI0005C24C54|nr:BolA family protein [Algiphilus aromaticivorans]